MSLLASHTNNPTITAWPMAALSIDGWSERELLRPDFRVDRRRAPRWRVPGTATLLTLGVDLGFLVELDRLDCAPWWLAGDSITPMTVGTRVSVGFSCPSCRPNAALVMRCERQKNGRYRIALRFDGVLIA